LPWRFAGCKEPENNTTSDIKVSTYAATEITATTAKVGGHVTVTGAVRVGELGVCWGTEKNPTATIAKRLLACALPWLVWMVSMA